MGQPLDQIIINAGITTTDDFLEVIAARELAEEFFDSRKSLQARR